MSYNPIGDSLPTSTNIVPLAQSDKSSPDQATTSSPISGELVERQPHTSITIEQWQYSRVQVESANPIKDKAISQYLLTQYAVERENIRQNIGIDTYA